MSKLPFNNDQKDKLQRILDYHLHLDDPQSRNQTENLIEQDPQARQLHDSLTRTLAPLAACEDEPVPAGLAQRTINYIDQHKQAQAIARSSAQIAAATDEPKPLTRESRSRWVLSNIREWVAVAAGIMLMFWVTQPAMQHARNRSQQIACMAQMQRTGNALHAYAADNDGFLPYVNFQPGGPWWNVGESGEQNHSNTRNLFLLIRQEYVNSDNFLCPGVEKKSPKKMPLDHESLQALKDFVCRMHVNYSSRLMPQAYNQEARRSRQIIILTDQNPLFMNIDCETQPENGVLRIAQPLEQSNSKNHGGKGQNVLRLDGSVRFHASRFVGTNQDDIFTIKAVDTYRGVEMPQSEDDDFIAP